MVKWAEKIWGWMKRWRLLQRFLLRSRDKMKRLYPGDDGEERIKKYYIETIVLLIEIGLSGVALLAVISVSQYASGTDNITFLEREEYGGGTKYIDLKGYGENGLWVEKSIEINERAYTEEELKNLYEELVSVLGKRIKGDNESLSRVEQDLVLPESVKGFPFLIRWKSDDRSVINEEGKLLKEYRKTKKEVNITAKITHEAFSAEESWEILVMPSRWTKEEIWEQNVENALHKSDEESLTESKWFLPEVLNGEKIYWEIQKTDSGIKIIMLLSICMLLVIWGRNNDLKRKLKQRDMDLEEEYSGVVTRLVLYLGAGMSMKGAFKKIATTYKEKGRQSVAMQEVLLTCREMEDGVYENVCYENFGKRCGKQEYVRLGTLLSQNLRKGNSELLNRLQEEVELSGERQKHLIKRRGEEASTKLLGPMVLLLGVTMVLIMIPAFSGIG